MGTGDGLYERNGIWWMRTDPFTKKRSSTGQRSYAAAKRELDRGKAVTAAAADRAADQTTRLVDMAALLLEQKEARRSAATAHFYEFKLGHLVRVAGPEAVMADIDPGWVDRYVAQRTREGSNSIGKELTALRQVCKLAARAHPLPHAAAAGRGLPVATAGRVGQHAA